MVTCEKGAVWLFLGALFYRRVWLEATSGFVQFILLPQERMPSDLSRENTSMPLSKAYLEEVSPSPDNTHTHVTVRESEGSL